MAGYSKDDEGLSKALKGADLVVIPAGVPRKPGMTRDDLFNVGDIKNLWTGIHPLQRLSNQHPYALYRLSNRLGNQINAGIVRDLANAMVTNCPKAFILVISNPVNSTVPIVAEVFKKAGVFDPKR